MTKQYATMILAGAWALVSVMSSPATTYYVNDLSHAYDTYCTTTGNAENDGLTPATPKAHLTDVLDVLAEGDTVYVDTGEYEFPATAEIRILGSNLVSIVGSTNGTAFYGNQTIISVAHTASTAARAAPIAFSNLSLTITLASEKAGSVMSVNWAAVHLNNVRLSSPLSPAFSHYALRNSSFQRCVLDGSAALYDRYALGVNAMGFTNCTLIARGSLLGLSDRMTTFDHCILVSLGNYVCGSLNPEKIYGNHNLFYSPVGLSSASVAGWQQMEEVCTNLTDSIWGNPLFVDVDHGDYHLSSPQGHFVEHMTGMGVITGREWVVDAALPYSPAIDAGDAAVGNELSPNGGRRNLGAYGGTEWASKSRPVGTKWLQVLNGNDGSVVVGNFGLRWNAGNFASGEKVQVQLSTNAGAQWVTLKTVAAATQSYAWTVTAAQASPQCLWRVRATNDASVVSTTERIFSARPSTSMSFKFYVNDDSLTDDRFCTVTGNDDNDGLSPSTPKRTIQSVLDTYALYAGDEIRVDAGTYDEESPVAFGIYDSGVSGAPVVLRGAGSSTILARGNQTWDVVQANSAQWLTLKDMVLNGGRYGFFANSSANLSLENVEVVGNQVGIYIQGALATNISMDHLSIHGNNYGINAAAPQNVAWASNSVIWNNATALTGKSPLLEVSHSIIGGDAACTLLGSTTFPAGDYNVLQVSKFSSAIANLTEFQAAQENWQHCAVLDPLFVDAANGDFHLRSVSGHCTVNGTVTNWTNDSVHSPAIDFGSSSSAYVNEPAPNGGRANVGLYANTAQASKSRTNAWIQIMSFNDGGTLNAQSGANIRWTAGNLESGSKLTLWLSRDGGDSWEVLASGIDAAAGSYTYKKVSVENNSSLNAYLRLTVSEDEGVASQTAKPLTYRDGAFSFYVNDSSTVGDVYCTSIGMAGAGRGLSPGSPLDSLQNLLAQYDLSQGDVVFVDTGAYADANPITFKRLGVNAESAEPNVQIFGSTNWAAGGTVIGRRNVRRALGMSIPAMVSNLVVKNLTFTNCQVGVIVSNAVNITLEGIQVNGATMAGMTVGSRSENVQILHSSAVGSGVGIQVAANSFGTVIDHCVLWNNPTGVQSAAGATVTLKNCILGAEAYGSVLYSLAKGHALTANHNGVHAAADAVFGRYADGSWSCDNLYAWQQETGLDADSIPGPPMMADPDNYDYHLMTERTLGRYLPSGARTTDEASSPLLKAGENGENIGMWGGTPTASQAQDGNWLAAWSFRDAGSVKSGNVPLRWSASPEMSNDTVRVDYSVNGGKTWTNIANNLAARSGVTIWNTTGIADTPAAMWRVVAEADESCASDNGVFFAIRNQPLAIYLATETANTNTATYVTAPGQTDNWEATRSAPLSSLKQALEHYDLEGGDTIYLERGAYTENEGMRMGYKQSGTTNQPVRFVGVTNSPFDAVVLELGLRRQGTSVLTLDCVQNVLIDSVMFSNAWTGVTVANAGGIELNRTRFGYFVTNALNAASGASVRLGHSVLENVLGYGVMAHTGSVVHVDHVFIPNSVHTALRLWGGQVSVSNSIIEVAGQGHAAYLMQSVPTTLASDYNCLRVSDSATIARYTNGKTDRFLYDWQTSRGGANDMRSSGYAPQMVDVENGDYHLRSAAGRFEASTQSWVEDEVSSPLIDLGTGAYANEPENNGGQANIGPYGNTTEASKSTGTAKIVPLTMSDGGTMSGAVTLYWGWNGIAGNTRVNVLFSGDGGTTWTNQIAHNIYLNQGATGLAWDTTNVTSTAMGVWRVETMDGNVVGQTETLFSVRNEALNYYVNDGSTHGDVYCTAVGAASNDGLSPETPMDNLERLFGRYGLAPGDTVYIDTGTYVRQAPLTLVPGFEAATNSLVIQGSTNVLAGGTVFSNSVRTNAVFVLSSAASMDIRHITLKGGAAGLSLQSSSANRFYRILSDGAKRNAFELDVRSGNNVFEECGAVEFGQDGLYLAPIQNVSSQFPQTNHWIGGIMISYGMNPTNSALPLNTSTFVEVTSGKLFITNSAFQVNGSKDVIYAATEGTIVADYNAYEIGLPSVEWAQWRKPETVTYGIQSKVLGHLASWRTETGQDLHSLEGKLRFADVHARDFHPLSPGGWYDRETGLWVTNDLDVSVLVASGMAGNNIGWYPEGEEASRPTETLSCALQSYNDGGLAEGLVELSWVMQGGTGKENIAIFISTNSGVSWQSAGTAVASAGVFVWDSSTMPSCASARWQLRFAGAELATSARDFVIHNQPLAYYVNDEDTTGDLWCRQSGDDSHTGYTPDQPKGSLDSLIQSCTLGAGDTIYVDRGIYAGAGAIQLDYRDSGSTLAPVLIKGVPHAGTVLTNSGLSFQNTRNICLSDLVIHPLVDGVSMAHVEGMAMDSVDILRAPGNAVSLTICSNVTMTHTLMANATTNGVYSLASYGVYVDQSTIAGNGRGCVQAIQQTQGAVNTNRFDSFISVSNSILTASGTRVPVYNGTARFVGNYNDLYTENGALIALVTTNSMTKELGSVNEWYNECGQESASLSHDPLFVDARRLDYHVKSEVGHWTSSGDVIDSESSSMMDAGNPAVPVGEEPAPNGGRVNLGRYGGTDEASKTPDAGALILISLNDGGKASGDAFPITWLGRGSVTNQILQIEYWNGSSWQVLAQNIPVSRSTWAWDTTSLRPSVQGRLRLTASDGTVVENNSYFSVRNAGDTFSFYLNDASTEGDQYCTKAGSDAADGLTPGTPMANLNTLLATYDLESGDTVYVDTGIYRSGASPWHITQADTAGAEDVPPVVIQGPTNTLFGGAILDRQRNPVGILVNYGAGLELRNLCVSNALSAAFSIQDSYSVRLVGDVAENVGTGFAIDGGSQVRLEHSVVFAADVGAAVTTASAVETNAIDPVITHCLFLQIVQADLALSGQRTVYAHHNIYSIESGGYVYNVSRRTHFVSDYNCFVLDAGDRVLERVVERTLSPVNDVFDTVGTWAMDSGNDTHSYEGDPLFVDAAARDFHLQSTAGHYNMATKQWVKDAADSPLIDAGDPHEGTVEEPTPNGGRSNIGLYGGTSQASKSGTSGHFVLLSYNNGGVASGRVPLTWNALGACSNSTVRIDISADGGEQWTTIGREIAASIGEVLWNSTAADSGPLYYWRIVDEGGQYETVTSVKPFILHNTGITYYVNDDTLAEGDYCTAYGASENDGLTPATPMRWLSDVVATYQLRAGDIVYVDGGRYQTDDTTSFDELDSGTVSRSDGEFIHIQGQIASQAEKTVFIKPSDDGSILSFDGAYGIRLSDVQMIGSSNSVALKDSYFIDFKGLEARNAKIGIRADASSNLCVSHSAIVGMTDAAIDFSATGQMFHNIALMNTVLWSNHYGVHLRSGHVHVTNSVIGVLGPNDFAYYTHSDVPEHRIVADYNAIYVQAGKTAGIQSGMNNAARTTLYTRVSAWAVGQNQDIHSLAQDPGFVNADEGDFHLKSVSGYWSGTDWAYSSGSSMLIDAGTPRSTAWVYEPDPNGRRVNIGMYGGTAEASKTPQTGWLTPLTLVDGGSASGPISFEWQAGGAATNDTVCIEYSADNGVTWQSIICGWPAAEESYTWDSSGYGSSALSLWRVYSERDASIMGTTMHPFMLRNGGSIPFYVNDTLDEGDVYCTAAGDDANDGLTPATPKASLQSVLEDYELADADIVYVDAGRYNAGSPPITIDGTDSGHDDQYVIIQGSTNPVARTVFHGANEDDCVFNLSYAENVWLKDLVIENAQEGVTMSMCINCQLEDVRIQLNRSRGITISRSEGTVLNRTLLWRNVSTTGGVAMVVGAASDVTLLNSILWGSWTAIRSTQGIEVNVTNCVLQARNVDGRIFDFSYQSVITNVVHADYNVYRRRDGAILAEQANMVGGSDLFDDLAGWSRAIQGDRHSLAMEPAFIDADGAGDFHLKSPMGYFTTNNWIPGGNHWRFALELSPLVDAGDPSFDVGEEEDPNGGICNVGIYGGTAQASLTPDYEPWVTALSFNEECVITTNALLYWNYGGMPEGTTVTLEYTLDFGVHWIEIASGVPVEQREYEWDVATLPLTVAMKWRVLASTGESDESDAYVAVKTRTYDYYVNDDSTSGDVYCQTTGREWTDETGIGQSPNQPLRSMLDVFAHYPVGAGDRVFVDTGTYVLGTNVLTVGNANSGVSGFPLEIQGSTNWQAGGSVLVGDVATDNLVLLNVRNVSLSDLRLMGMKDGLVLQNASDVNLRRMDFRDNADNGIIGQNAADIWVENSVFAGNGVSGIDFLRCNLGRRTINQSTFVNNGVSGVTIGFSGSISNSILAATNAGAVGVRLLGTSATMSGDYNLYWTSGPMVTNGTTKSSYWNVRSWQDEGGEAHSFSTDPRFVNLEGGDYHLQSRAGCWSNGVWVQARDTSWAIDAGNPDSLAYGQEPSPNGTRVNLGAYGGTEQASATDASQPELFTLSLNDGGVASDIQMLYWLWRGITSGTRVKLYYSPDKGATWQLVTESTVGQGKDGFEWMTDWSPSPLSKWKLELVSDPTVSGETEKTFVFRPSPLIYYVNDTNLVNDVYTTAVGDELNNGYQPESPMASVQQVLETYQLTPDDCILVDSGIYEIKQPITIASMHSGSAETPAKIIGSTNVVAQTVFIPGEGMSGAAIGLNYVHDFALSNLKLYGFELGVEIPQSCRRISLTDMDFQAMGQVAVASSMATDLRLTRVLVHDGLGHGVSFNQGQRIYLDGCVLWGNASNGVNIAQSGQVWVSNSVISASGFGHYCYMVSTGEVVHADYNDLYLSNAAQIASVHGKQYERMPQWVTTMGEDRHSLSVDPMFADPANGDFHPRSIYGRFSPTNGPNGAWVQDVQSAELSDVSPLIDLGGPKSSWANEPSPNGQRRNIGLYGDTWQASKSREDAWVEAITAMSGGLASGTFYLTWGYGGDIDSNSWVRLEYSPYNGSGDWYYIATNRIWTESYYWISNQKTVSGSEQWTTSPEGKWRLVLVSDTNVWDESASFGLRNKPFSYYVNNDSATGDVYTTALGDDSNTGFWPHVPKLTLQSLLEEVDLEPTDEVYVDTGEYYLMDTNNPIVWQASDGGAKGSPVRLIGSTNALRSSFVVSNLFAGGIIFDLNSEYVELRDVDFVNRFRGRGNVAVSMSGVELDVGKMSVDRGHLYLVSAGGLYSNVVVNSANVRLSGMSNRVTRMEVMSGTLDILGTNAVMENSVIYYQDKDVPAVTVRALSSAISNSTVVAANGTAISKTGTGQLTLANNILVAGGQGAVINWGNGVLKSDYNDLFTRGTDAWIGIVDGDKWEKLAYWQNASGVDVHSMSVDPKFANDASDFHLRSMAVSGRYDRKNNRWRTDSEHSPVIDMANTFLTAGAEPLPNGSRRNLGAYGGTEEGSKSITNFWVQAVSLNDGGVVKGTNVTLRWSQNRQAGIGNQTVRLEYSTDGLAWTKIAEGLSANQGIGEYHWDTTKFGDSFTAYWRVVSEADSSISDATDTAFNVRNHVADFYVATTGEDTNDGLSAANPMRNLQALLDRYDLEGGDVVHVAAGAYTNDTNIEVIWSRSGSEEDGPVLVDGEDGVTIAAGSPGITIHASDFEWNGAKMVAETTNETTGVVVDRGTGVTLSEFDFEGQTTAVLGDHARYLTLRNSSFWGTDVGVSLVGSRFNTLENLTFVDMPVGIKLEQSDENVLRNNIFKPKTYGVAYEIGTAVNLLSDAFMDYNIYDLGAEESSIYVGAPTELRRWQLAMDNDYRSEMGDAGLYNPDRGDFHPKSPYGRWNGSAFVMDADLSFAVDHGDPTMDVGDEVPDNGSRINIGRFGGLAQASKGSTNIAFGIRTLNEAGLVISSDDATWPLVWDAHLVDSNVMVNVQFSGNNVDWRTLATTNAYAEYYVWTFTTEQQTDSGLWRVISTDGTLLAQSTNSFEYVLAKFGFLTAPYRYHGLMRFKWQGALAGYRYIIEYTDDFGQTWQTWAPEYNGPEKINRSDFVMQPGDTALEYIFEDVTSFGKPQRWYRLSYIAPNTGESGE